MTGGEDKLLGQAKSVLPSEWYHNRWGKRVDSDDDMLEIMSLQIFQAGLAWKLIISRRDAFRRAFKKWRVGEVARMGPDDVDRVLKDASIIRNRAKIEACIKNARIMQQIGRENGSFCRWFYHVMEGDELHLLQKELRKTFKFMGPELARMWLMASGRIPTSENP